MKCPYCGQEAEWTSNDVVYGRRYGKSFMCYCCKNCDAYVGCHQNTRKPLGTMANRPLRKMRMYVHEALDPLWQTGVYSRKDVYKKLSKAFGFEVHIGSADEKLCNEIIKKLPEIFNPYLIIKNLNSVVAIKPKI